MLLVNLVIVYKNALVFTNIYQEYAVKRLICVTFQLQGYLVNWDIQKTVWDYLFGKDVFNVNHSNTTMIVTEPYFNFTSTQEALSEIFFEEYDIDALLRINGECLKCHRQRLCINYNFQLFSFFPFYFAFHFILL